MSEHLFLFSHSYDTSAFDIEADYLPRQPLEEILVRETGILAPAFCGLVEGFIALASFDLACSDLQECAQ